LSWTKHFRTAQNRTPNVNTGGGQGQGTSAKYSSFLPEIFAGHPNRIQRYYQFEDMSRDSDISAALDTIADFCTQSEEQQDHPFNINYTDEPTEAEVSLLDEGLTKWVKKNKFKARLWKIFRDTIKNGDAFFINDPETHEWHWVDHYAVELVKVSSDGRKKPQEYVVRNFDPNITEKFGTTITDISQYRNPNQNGGSNLSTSRPAAQPSSQQFSMVGNEIDPYTGQSLNRDQYAAIDADRMVHLSLNEGMGPDWPFGASILESVFKTFKQKEMLEDSILIYRVQRAPERRIFYIDVGDMPPIRAKGHIEAIKNEIHQRRIPSRSGGGTNVIDAAYNPVSIMDDYFFAQTSEGRGSKVETLPGGDSLGEIGDLTYFTKKMSRGLKIPTAYLSLGGDEQPAMYNDGKLGQTMIEEFKFNKYCMRLQSLLAPVFDRLFKDFLDASGVVFDENLFELQFHPPQNFTKYRQIELDLQQTQVYGAVQGIKHLSERYKLERYLGMREDELVKNAKLWAQENANKLKKVTGSTPAETDPEGDLSSVGVRPSGGGDFDFGPDDFGGDEADMGGGEDGAAPDAGGDAGGDAGAGGAGAPPPPPPAGGPAK
jgi:hypothetical protein